MTPTAKTCNVCSVCHQRNPSCPCCNPFFATAETCFDCYAYNESIIAACGIDPTSLTYYCNKTTATCTALQGSTGEYNNYTSCKHECGAQFQCHNNQCVVAAGGLPKEQCEAFCH